MSSKDKPSGKADTLSTCGARILVFIATCAILAGCSGPRIAAWDFPRARSAEGATPVLFTARLLDIRRAAPRDRADVVYVEGRGDWTIVVRVMESTPVIPPFVPKRNVTLAIEAPAAFFGTNDLKVGGRVDRRLAVWRGEDGRLHAARR